MNLLRTLWNRYRYAWTGVLTSCPDRHDMCVACKRCGTGHTYPGDICGDCWDAIERTELDMWGECSHCGDDHEDGQDCPKVAFERWQEERHYEDC